MPSSVDVGVLVMLMPGVPAVYTVVASGAISSSVGEPLPTSMPPRIVGVSGATLKVCAVAPSTFGPARSRLGGWSS